MKWIALYIPATENDYPSQGGFDSEKEAWDWVIDNGMCKFCTEEYNKDPDKGYYPCMAEWDVITEEEWKSYQQETSE